MNFENKIKLYPGRSDEQKAQLVDEIVKDVVAIAKYDEKSVSVVFEEIEKEEKILHTVHGNAYVQYKMNVSRYLII